MSEPAVYPTLIPTAWGAIEIRVSKRGVREVLLPPRARKKIEKEIPSSEVRKIQKQVLQAFQSYLSGNGEALQTIPLDPGEMTSFARRVFSQLRKMPAGQTTTYGDLARRVRAPGAARAVGAVMSRNRLPVLLPCHRVVPAGGGLGRYSGGKGWKKRLLSLESRGQASL